MRSVAAQDEKKPDENKLTFLPDGFEFPITTPVLTYHFPRAELMDAAAGWLTP